MKKLLLFLLLSSFGIPGYAQLSSPEKKAVALTAWAPPAPAHIKQVRPSTLENILYLSSGLQY